MLLLILPKNLIQIVVVKLSSKLWSKAYRLQKYKTGQQCSSIFVVDWTNVTFKCTFTRPYVQNLGYKSLELTSTSTSVRRYVHYVRCYVHYVRCYVQVYVSTCTMYVSTCKLPRVRNSRARARCGCAAGGLRSRRALTWVTCSGRRRRTHSPEAPAVSSTTTMRASRKSGSTTGSISTTILTQVVVAICFVCACFMVNRIVFLIFRDQKIIFVNSLS